MVKRSFICRLTPILPLALLSIGLNRSACADEPVKFIPFHHVTMDDVIWQPRIRKLVGETLPHAFKNTEVAQKRLRLCAMWLESGGTTEKPVPHRYNASDLYKVMEGAALMIQSEPDGKIEVMMDRIIDLIARAQKEDGYLYIAHITGSITPNNMGVRPYSHVSHSHELYNMGHLYEAAVAYARATGKTRLLEIAEKNARHINQAFFVGDPNYNGGVPVKQAPGHQEIEIGLVKLYNHTGNPLYLRMAKRFLDIRGVTYRPTGKGVDSPVYAQQHAPVAKQNQAVGHAVRATYQYAAMAEVDNLMGTEEFSDSLDQIWHDIVDTKMHITGGLGAVHGIEGFGPAYELPNKEAYLETCAAVGNVFFNMRMFLKHRDAKYVDVAEIALLNNCLAGIGLNGTSFFYPNPLEADFGHRPRAGWFGTACCPSNIARLIPQVSGYLYATDGDDLYCTLYGESKVQVEIAGGIVGVKQVTDYPWSGSIVFRVDPDIPREFTLRLRIPTWATSKLVPGNLYTATQNSTDWSVAINGNVTEPVVERGFAVLRRCWKPGDQVKLELPMPLKENMCTDKVAANQNRIAFSRGPIVLCAEGVDHQGAVQRIFVDSADSSSKSQIRKNGSFITGLHPLAIIATVPASRISEEGQVSDATLKLIPYFAWSNRDRSSMQVWFATTRELASNSLALTANTNFKSVTASHTYRGDSTDAVRIRRKPKNSADKSIPRWTAWPEVGIPQWVEIELAKPAAIRSIGVYFYDDQGGVQLPKAWHIEVPTPTGWKQVLPDSTDEYSTQPNAYNIVQPAKNLTTEKFRIVMTPRHSKTSVGILSVKMESTE